MLVVPSIDLAAGRAVRLLRGDMAQQTSYADGAEAVLALAGRLAQAGARRLHVVDLDAATGAGDNRRLVGRLIGEAGLDVQVAGGVRSLGDAERWLEMGAAAVVMGTAAVRDPETLAAVSRAHPDRVLTALDVRGGRPAVTGWSALEETGVVDVLRRWEGLPLRGVILTSVDQDGTLAGPDLALLQLARKATQHPLTYSGGVATLQHLEDLAAAGAAAVILGKSLLEGLIPLSEALSRWPPS